MIDFSQSRDNAKVLIERFLESGEQPKFMEYLCYKQCYVDAVFHGYGAEYVVNHFQIYVALPENEICQTVECSIYGKINTVKSCFFACTGKDFIAEASKQGVAFEMREGKLFLIKQTQREMLEVEYDKYSYYSRRASKAAN